MEIAMSLYYLQKLLYTLNREPALQARFKADPQSVIADYDLTEEERKALTEPDVGLLYVLGVNGQLLMHYAALVGQSWDQYIDAMRQGVRQYGPVRAGIYAMVDE
jgi:Aromatic-ring-opening dioxygenase LigAB, LigA subunit